MVDHFHLFPHLGRIRLRAIARSPRRVAVQKTHAFPAPRPPARTQEHPLLPPFALVAPPCEVAPPREPLFGPPVPPVPPVPLAIPPAPLLPATAPLPPVAGLPPRPLLPPLAIAPPAPEDDVPPVALLP